MLARNEDEYGMAERLAWEANEPPITRELIVAFGGHGFLFNLRMWAARVGNISCEYVPVEDYYRKRYETLLGTGMAERGDVIPLEDRLQVMRINDLRQFARDLGITEKFRNKAQAAAVVAQHPDAEKDFSRDCSPWDLFKLKPWPGFDGEQFQASWAEYEEEARETIREKRSDYEMDDY